MVVQDGDRITGENGETLLEGRDYFVGYGPTAVYLDLRRNTLSSYIARGTGPKVHDKLARDQYVLPVFLRSELDRWVRARPGQGARTDLVKTGQ